MKYWLYQENQVKGPYDRAEMGRLPGFDEDTLVCPEGLKGTEMGDWQRAGRMPELAVLFGSTSVATTSPERVDPAISNALSDLRIRISELEKSFEEFERQAKAREEAASSARLSAPIDQPVVDHEARTRLGELESKIADLLALAPRLSALQELEQAVKELREKMNALESRQMIPAAEKEPEPPPVPAISPPVAELPSVMAPPTLTATPEPRDFKVEPPSLGTPASVVMEDLTIGGATPPPPPPPVPDILKQSAALGSKKGPTQPPKASRAATDLGPTQIPMRKGWTAKQKMAVLLLAGLFAVGMVFVVSFSGKSGKPSQSDETATSETTPSMKSEVAAPPVQDQMPAPDFSQEAVDLVRGYQLPGLGQTLEDRLRLAHPKAYPVNGELSPWMVEKLGSGEDKYQVSFYVGTKPVYVFLVQPKLKLVQGLNAEAVSLLAGTPVKMQPPPAPRKTQRRTAPARKRTVRAQGSGAMVIAPKKKSSRQDSNSAIDQILGGGAGSTDSSQTQ